MNVTLLLVFCSFQGPSQCDGYSNWSVQSGHKPGRHGKPGNLREFEKLSKSQGKLREI